MCCNFEKKCTNSHKIVQGCITSLTLKCIRYLSLPFVHKGGPLRPILRKVLFRRNFSTKLAPYLYTPKATINQQKQIGKHLPFQNGGQYTKFHFAKTVM